MFSIYQTSETQRKVRSVLTQLVTPIETSTSYKLYPSQLEYLLYAQSKARQGLLPGRTSIFTPNNARIFVELLTRHPYIMTAYGGAGKMIEVIAPSEAVPYYITGTNTWTTQERIARVCLTDDTRDTRGTFPELNMTQVYDPIPPEKIVDLGVKVKLYSVANPTTAPTYTFITEQAWAMEKNAFLIDPTGTSTTYYRVSIDFAGYEYWWHNVFQQGAFYNTISFKTTAETTSLVAMSAASIPMIQEKPASTGTGGVVIIGGGGKGLPR